LIEVEVERVLKVSVITVTVCFCGSKEDYV